MPGTGTATLSFGSTPTAEGSVTVSGQTGILTTSFAEAFIMGNDSTSDNTTTDHQFAGIALRLVCADLVANTGFTIYVTSIAGLISGDLKIRWVWS